jgi:peptide/nickel transport system permease protein
MPEQRSKAPVQGVPSETRPPAQSEGAAPSGDSIFAESPEELMVDAILATEGGAAGVGPAGAGAVDEIRAKKKLGFVFWLCVGWIGLVILLAVFANVLPLRSYRTNLVGPPRLHPSAHFWLGTDENGRDMLSRTIFGARVSLIVGFASIFLGLLIGGALGVIAGYYKGRIGTFIMGCMDVMLAFPALVFALVIVTFLGQSLTNVTLAIAVISIAPIARIIRASTLTFAEREFVMAARTLGAKNWRIITREILPNVILPAASFSLIAVALAIVGEGALAFLGLSVPAPTPTWGGMINEGRGFLQLDPYISMIPAAAMFITVLAFNFAGDSLRAFFDVKEGAL